MQEEDRTQPLVTTSSMILGRYHLLRKIGHGGMGEVWLAEDPRLHRQVAIKTLPVHNQSDQEFLQRFEREARAAAALNHPHILPVHDYGDQTLPDGQAITYIVMPYVAGGTLTDRLKTLATNGQLMPSEEALIYLSQAAQAIDYAHERNVLHRDIKPSNMLLRDDNWLMLADFGIARMLTSDQEHLTQAGVGIGTPEYMAPEQAQGKPEPTSDNYSLAILAYQIFTGQLPFRAETPYATTIQHMTTPPPAPRQINPNLLPTLELALLHGLTKNPQQRPRSAQDFVQELRQALNGIPLEGTFSTVPLADAVPTVLTPSNTPSPVVSSTQPSMETVPLPSQQQGITRRQILIAGGTGAAALVAAGGIGAWAFTSHQKTTSVTTMTKPTPAPNPDAPIMALTGHTQPVSGLAWSPKTPSMLISGGTDQQTLLWDIQAMLSGQENPGSPKARQLFNTTGKLLVAWSPDGNNVAIGNSSFQLNASNPNVIDTLTDIYQADLSQRIAGYDTKLMTYFRTTYIQSLHWAPGKYLVSVSHPHETTGTGAFMLEFRDPLHPEQGLISLHENNFAYAIANSPDGNWQAIGMGLGLAVGQLQRTGSNVSWKTSAFLQFGKDQSGKDQSYPIGAVSWSPDGKYVTGINNSLFIGNLMPISLFSIWNWQSGAQFPFTLPSSSTVLTTAVWCPAPSSTLLATGAKDGKVYIWNFNSQTASGTGNALPTRTLQGLPAEITTLAWSVDGRWLAAAYKDVKASILIWKF